MNLDLDCVAGFVAVLRQRHFGRAAAELHLSASALSKKVQRLEQQIGVRLLHRSPAGVLGPTRAGERFFTAAVLLLDAAERAARTARG